MPRNDDLDAHFRAHPRLKKYAEIFDAHRNKAVAQQQRVAWYALILAAATVYYILATKGGSWFPADWPLTWPGPPKP